MDSLFNIPAEISSDGGIKYDLNQFKNAIKELTKPQTRNVRIIIVDDFKNTTMKQLQYYYGILLKDVCKAYDSIGYKMDIIEADKEMREMFLYYYVTTFSTGRSVKKTFSLDTNAGKVPSTKDMSRFFEDIVQHCAMNMSFVIQLPDDIKDTNLNFNR